MDAINLEMDCNYCTERKLALQFFRGALSWMNDDWQTTLKSENNKYVLGDLKDADIPGLIGKLGKLVVNMQSTKTWTDLNDAKRKDIVLTSILRTRRPCRSKLTPIKLIRRKFH